MPLKNVHLHKISFMFAITFFTLFTFSPPSRTCRAKALDTDSLQQLLPAEPSTSLEGFQSDPKSAVLSLAQARFKQGLWEEAARHSRQLIRMESGHTVGHGILGTVYAITGNKKMAKKELANLKKSNQSFWPDLIHAILTAQAGKLGIAEKHLASAMGKKPRHPVAIYYAGSLDLARNKLEDAEKSFKAVIETQPEFTPALAGLGQVCLRQKRMESAAGYYQKALAHQPEMLVYRKQLIDIYRAMGNSDAANREMRKTLYYVPGVKQHYLNQGMQLLTMGKYRQAIEQMDKAIENYQRIPEAHYIKAAALANLKQKKAAGENIEAFITQQWASPIAHHYAGMCYLAMDQINQAEMQFRTVIRLNPAMGKSFVPLTVIEQIKGNYDLMLQGLRLARTGGEPPMLVDYLAAHAFLAKGDETEYKRRMKQAAALIPGLDPAIDFTLPAPGKAGRFTTGRNLMLLFFLNGWYGKAIAVCDELIRENRKDRFALYYLAAAKTAQGRSKEAIGVYKSLLSVEPNLYIAHMGIAKGYMQAGDLKRAENAYGKVIAINPRYAPAYVAKGDLLVEKGDEPAAIATYQKAMAMDPDFPGTYHRLAMIYAEKPEKHEEALTLSLEAEKLAPDDPVSLDVTGWVHVQKGDVQKGIESLTAASEKRPNDPLIKYHLGVAHHKNNDPKAARQALAAAVRISGKFKGVKHAREILSRIAP